MRRQAAQKDWPRLGEFSKGLLTLALEHGLDLMRTRNATRRSWFFACQGILVLWIVFFQVVLPAQEPPRIRIPDAALPQAAQLELVLQQGQNLEKSRRWGDALAHYEKAIKLFPGHRDIQQHYHLAQGHYDVSRRYADISFKNSFQQLDARKATQTYTEVLNKIQTFYVESPNWRRLVQRGTESLLIALTEPAFVKTHLLQLPANRRLAVQEKIRSRVREAQIISRYQAEQLVLEISQLAENEIRLPPSACIMEYTCGALMELDLYSGFLTVNQLADVFAQIEGNFVGLGIELQLVRDALSIVKVIEGGPASQAGLEIGDRIVAVDGETVFKLKPNVAADKLRGQAGSEVRVAIVHPTGLQEDFILTRRRVEVPSIEGVKILLPQDGIGYLKITSFQKTTERSMDAALHSLNRAGMRGLILDLRGNPGGFLDASIDLADKFLSHGIIVSTKGRRPMESVQYQAHDLGTWKTPLIVLIDKDSASASEIFAGAIRDHRRGLVVGECSYGKGSVQGIFPLSASPVGVRLTTAKFYSPNGHAISGRGVTPDVLVQQVNKPPVAVGNLPKAVADPVLDTAVKLLRKEVLAVVPQR